MDQAYRHVKHIYVMEQKPNFLTLLWLLIHISPVVTIDTLSIAVTNQHFCVSRCLGILSIAEKNLPFVLSCDAPIDNACYCATGSDAVSKASSLINNCASNLCASGDASNDLNSIHSAYASYCLKAGYTQAGATDWYHPAGGTTATPKASPTQPISTTTELTLATRTVPPSTGDGYSTQSQGKWQVLFAMILLDLAVVQVRGPTSLRGTANLVKPL